MDQTLHWYVGYVKSCQERKVAEALARLGIGFYLPVRKEIHKWSDRRKVVDSLVLPRLIFVRGTEADRVRSLREIPALYAYIMARGGEVRKAAIVPDAEMESFRAMVDRGREKVELFAGPVAPGDRVRVTDGPLKGMECEVVRTGAHFYMVARLSMLGAATMEVSADSIEKLEAADK